MLCFFLSLVDKSVVEEVEEVKKSRSSELTVNEQQNPDCGQILEVSASRAMAKSRRPGDIFPTFNHLLEPSLYRQIRSP